MPTDDLPANFGQEVIAEYVARVMVKHMRGELKDTKQHPMWLRRLLFKAAKQIVKVRQ
jgi:hypothetical protein